MSFYKLTERQKAFAIKKNLLKDPKYKPFDQTDLGGFGFIHNFCQHKGESCSIAKTVRTLATEGVNIYLIGDRIIQVTLGLKDIKFQVNQMGESQAEIKDF